MPKITSVAKTEIYPVMEKSMSTRLKEYKTNIENFIRVRSKDLYDTVPVGRIPFGAEDYDLFFNAINVKKDDITEMLSHTFYWNMNYNPSAAKDEFTMCLMMIIRYFTLHNDIKNAEISSVYLAFSGKFYPSIHYGKFRISPEDYRYVMEYVLNNVLTNKYDLKREGSVFGAIMSICKTWLRTYTPKLRDPDDEDVSDIIQQLHGRIKAFLHNISKAYYAAYEKKEFLTYGSDSNENETYRVADNDSLIAERIVENAMNWITTKNVDFDVCRMASDKNVHVEEVKSIIESIQEDKDNLILIREFLRLIVTVYFSESKDRDVTSYEFLAKSVVAKPNSKNPNVIRQKEIVENWLNENSPQYRKRKSRQATKSSYHKSVTTYYVIIIHKANVR